MRAAHFIYNGFSEYEVALACAMIAGHGGSITHVSFGGEPVKGEGQFMLLPAENFEEVEPAEYDLLLISGMLNIGPYWDRAEIYEKIAEFDQHEKVIASICGGPLFLAKAGVLKGRRYTCGIPEQDREMARVFDGAEFVDERVVTDNRVITAQGFASVDFALAIADQFGLFAEGARDQFAEFWQRP